MLQSEKPEELNEAELEEALMILFKRVQTDDAFRALCISNPDEAIFKISGKRPPAGKNLQFVEPD